MLGRSWTKKIATGLSFCTLLSAAVISAQVSADPQLTEVVADERRGDAAKRDMYRHPTQTLSFFGIKPTDTVIELAPGAGAWYTAILAPYLKAEGQFIAANFVTTGDEKSYYVRAGKKFLKKVEMNKDWWGDIQVVEFYPPEASKLAEPNSVDMVVSFRSLHGWHRDGNLQDVVASVYRALKPGGVFGVVQHRSLPSKTNEELRGTGYINQNEAIALIEAAGFSLQASSEINANAKDTKDHPKGVWTLPPSLRLKDQDKDKYLAIGESDRMTLKFVKP
ncbi:methyltransferase domain-containing protein [Neiella marina]|uniref:Methyltransferase domain-containing protein n=1 Tax=Neiella holothuriorum TaxID=2870530 RepID=A0ABS7ECY7_9GAMM|nr:methyltransferase domain-containing protein [Neiella holothuriorum]MBW8190171.1 methyltransferase domain-containing protein [Neiella holothuriorum]